MKNIKTNSIKRLYAAINIIHLTLDMVNHNLNAVH